MTSIAISFNITSVIELDLTLAKLITNGILVRFLLYPVPGTGQC
jgi:hypothetical protein